MHPYNGLNALIPPPLPENEEQCCCRAFEAINHEPRADFAKPGTSPERIIENAKRIFRYPDDRHVPLKTKGAKRMFKIKYEHAIVEPPEDEERSPSFLLHREYVEETCEIEDQPTRVHEVLTGEWAVNLRLAHASLDNVAYWTDARWVRKREKEPAEAHHLIRYKDRCSMCGRGRLPEEEPEEEPEEILEEVSVAMSEKVPEAVSKKVSETASDNVLEKVPEKLPGEVPGEVPGEGFGEVLEKAPEKGLETVSDKVSGNGQGVVVERTPERVSETVSEKATQKVLEMVPEKAPAEVPEK